jgi:CBS domain-containing protein
MKKAHKNGQVSPMVLPAQTAQNLMNANPLSIRQDATVGEAITFLTDKGFSAAPVIDEAGRPVGVLSRADLVTHQRERGHSGAVPDYFQAADLAAGRTSPAGQLIPAVSDRTPVRDIMTPVVFSVTPQTSARKVIEDMVGLKVHRLFVIDDAGVLVGVISALDVLRRLQAEVPEPAI